MSPYIYLLTFFVGCCLYIASCEYLARVNITSHIVNTIVYFTMGMGLFWGIMGIAGAVAKCETGLKYRNNPIDELTEK